jgi:endo-alpha-1,4-polygalactosaminidase (GH114 family)
MNGPADLLTALAVLGALLVFSSPAHGQAASETVQAERLHVAASSGHVVRDPSAAGHRALALTGRGAARGRVRLHLASRLDVVARAAGCSGAPQLLVVTVDGVRILSTAVRGRRRWAVLHGAATLRAGSHTVSLRLIKPRGRSRCRRSVRIDRLAFVATPAPPSGGPPTTTAPAAPWIPAPGTTWQWQLSGPIDQSVDAEMYDIDLFDTHAATVANLHAQGRHVVCYLDAGTYEPGRPDSASYPAAVLGARVEGWPGERWLDIRRLDVLRPIVERRLDLCRQKDFDGVEPDNVDAYTNASGFSLSATDQLTFNRFVAAAAHARGLSVGLKNDLDQTAALQPDFDWALDEQCFQYHECDALQPFARAGKAVFIAEYELDPSAFCAQARAAGYAAIRKRLALDAWRQAC